MKIKKGDNVKILLGKDLAEIVEAQQKLAAEKVIAEVMPEEKEPEVEVKTEAEKKEKPARPSKVSKKRSKKNVSAT